MGTQIPLNVAQQISRSPLQGVPDRLLKLAQFREQQEQFDELKGLRERELEIRSAGALGKLQAKRAAQEDAKAKTEEKKFFNIIDTLKNDADRLVAERVRVKGDFLLEEENVTALNDLIRRAETRQDLAPGSLSQRVTPTDLVFGTSSTIKSASKARKSLEQTQGKGARGARRLEHAPTEVGDVKLPNIGGTTTQDELNRREAQLEQANITDDELRQARQAFAQSYEGKSPTDDEFIFWLFNHLQSLRSQ